MRLYGNVMQDVLGLILGGGQGSRLYPLTQKRSKPAVPIAGKYRLIDIPISNCLHAGIEKIAILTQFNSVSLHRHITNTYRRDMFTQGWVDCWRLSKHRKVRDGIRGPRMLCGNNWWRLKTPTRKYVLILAGDHLYQMDYREFVNYHIETKRTLP